MLRDQDRRRWVDRLGVPDHQVERDHLVSRILLAVPEILPDAVFFGGTALCRTHLPHWRLSEDVDLLVVRPLRARDRVDGQLPRLLRREYPGLELTWNDRDATVSGTARADGLAVQVHLVELDASYSRYPTEDVDVLLRYADLPEAISMPCPTLPGATAMKLTAWTMRAAARDLCDLFGLTQIGAITGDALEIAAEAARPVQRHSFDDDHLPSEAEWFAALAHQMREPPSRRRALETVRSAVEREAGWE